MYNSIIVKLCDFEKSGVTELTVKEELEKIKYNEHCDWLDFRFQKKPVYSFLKRTGDILLSLIALICLSPIFIITALLIMIKDFGNPFFAQDRVGRNGKIFKMYKFRSMYKDAEARKAELIDLNETDGTLFKIKEDPRILGTVGRIIRRTSIDELPQLVNILKGDMAIIGPRPFIPAEHKLFTPKRELVRPGLSCYWQISGKNDLSKEMSNYCDKKYIMDRGVWTDIKIMFKTVAVVFKSENS